MSREKLNAAASHFLGRILPTATGKHFAELNNAEALLGAYRRYTGPAVTAFGRQITPEFMLKVKSGAVPVQADNPVLGADPVPDDAPNHPLTWMRFAADAKVDDQATVQDLMGDLDTYAQKKFALAGVDVNITDDTPAPANSAAWAQAIQANRSAVPENLATLTEVPAPFKTVAPTLTAFRLILSHFFTYDETGAYYAKWSGAGRQIPQNLTDAYKQKNVREVKLERNQLYVYMLAPKRLFTTQAADAHDYCESVLRLDETNNPANPFFPTLVHNAYRRIEGTAAFHDFIFFESEDGLGLPISRELRAKVSPALEQFLISIPTDQEAKARFFHDSTEVVEGTPPAVHLTATTQGPLTLPDDVLSSESSSGKVISMLAPVDKVLDIAAMPAVQYLDLSGRPQKYMLNLVRPAIDFDTFRAKYPAAKQDGAGVIVGIIDSGIDGTHPAFNDASGNSRIIAVWEQDQGAKGNPNSPAKKHATVAAYKKLDYGRELTGALVRGATDDPEEGHGTHVTGIAAGADVTAGGTLPRGIASQAKIIVVKAIGANQGNPIDGLRYIFQKAKELNMPCVVNMSFGHHDHGHDGTDDLSRELTDQLRDSSGNYLPGRVLVASAGNERDDPMHVRRDLAATASTTFRYTVNKLARRPSNVDLVTMWLRPIVTGGAKPNIRVAVQHPASGWTSTAATPGTSPTVIPVPGINVALVLAYGDKDIHNGDYNVRVGFVSTAPGHPTPPLPREEWRIILTNNSSTALEVHAWAAQPRAKGGFEATTTLDDNTFKIGSPGAARDVITVAASTTRNAWPDIDGGAGHAVAEDIGDVANFSSPGPIRTCSDRLLHLFFLTLNLTHPSPDITAPGCLTQSALANNVPITFPASAPADDPRRYNRSMVMNGNSWLMQGTSMAAPVVTGLVACMLADEPGLTQSEACRRVQAAGKFPAKTKYDPAHANGDAWGFGLVNAPALKP